MREFKTAAKKALTEDDEYVFKVDGHECKALRPNEGQIALLIASEANPLADDNEKIAATINFALTIFETDTRHYLGKRLINPDHPDNVAFEQFQFEDLMNIVHGVIEEFAGRPTKPSSDSTSSREIGGRSSTDGASASELDSSDSRRLTPVT